jgi:NADPH:quinone reductase-like Zn-dependent oxidoreductase
VGVIDGLGADVTDFSVGDRVMGDLVMVRGGFAEYACLSAAELVKVPDRLSDEVAACLPQAGGIAVEGTKGLNEGDTFLINGAGGGSGTMALQLAKSRGTLVTAVDNSSKIDWLKSLGADEIIDYRAFDFADSEKQWDRILDMVATRHPSRISKVLSAGGRYQALGGNVGILLSLVFGGLRFRLQNKSIGMLMVSSGRDLTERVVQMAIEEKLSPQIEAVLPLSSVPEALRRTGLGEVKGKLVIKP